MVKIRLPRLSFFLLISIILVFLAYTLKEADPLIAVSLYKAHLMSLGGWGGYWLDRAIFTYSRPHTYCSNNICATPEEHRIWADKQSRAELRRAIIVAAALICVGLAA